MSLWIGHGSFIIAIRGCLGGVTQQPLPRWSWPGEADALIKTIFITLVQKTNRTAACASRGGAAFTIWPKLALLMSPSTAAGPKNCA